MNDKWGALKDFKEKHTLELLDFLNKKTVASHIQSVCVKSVNTSQSIEGGQLTKIQN